MNAERLHAVAQTVLGDFEALNILNLLQNVDSTLASSISQPTPQNAEAFQQALKALEEALAKCESNSFVPSHERILEAIGGADKVGVGLDLQLHAILEEEQITPASALTRIQKHRQEVVAFHQRLTQLVACFEALKVGTDAPEENEAELGVLMPRDLVENDIAGLSKELRLMDRYLKILAEIVGGKVESFKIRSLGTDSLDVYLTASAVVAAFIMAAVERVAALYKQILEIRVLRIQLEEKKVPTTAVRKHEDEAVKLGIDEISKDLLREFYRGKDAARRNELRGWLVLALKFMADRIDKGVDIEATVAPHMEEREGEKETAAESSPEKDAVAAIARSGHVLRALSRVPEPVLQLPEAELREIEEEKEN